jgi:azurin
MKPRALQASWRQLLQGAEMRLTVFLSTLILAIGSSAARPGAQTLKATTSNTPTAAKAAPAASVRTIDIYGTDEMKYSLNEIVAKRGEVLRIRLISKGTIPKIAMAHNVVIVKPATNLAKFIETGAPFRDTDFIAPTMKAQVLAATRFAGPGETVELTFQVPKVAGTYPYLCTFSGHFQAGMKGVIIVK